MIPIMFLIILTRRRQQIQIMRFADSQLCPKNKCHRDIQFENYFDFSDIWIKSAEYAHHKTFVRLFRIWKHSVQFRLKILEVSYENYS